MQNRPDASPEMEEEMIRTMDTTFTPLGPADTIYIPACFKVSQADHDSALAELHAILPVVEAYQEGTKVRVCSPFAPVAPLWRLTKTGGER